MRNLFLIIFIIISFDSRAQVIISGKINNIPSDIEVYASYYNNPIEYDEVSSIRVKPDKKGKVRLELKCSEATLAHLYIGDRDINIYLQPKSNIHFECDYDDLYKTIKFEGKNAADNNYLAAEFLESFYYKSHAYNSYNDENQYKVYVDSLEDANMNFLKAYGVSKLSKSFKNHITKSIQYEYIYPRSLFIIGFDTANNKWFRKNVSAQYFDFLKSINVDDQDAFDNDKYILALEIYLSKCYDNLIKIPDSLNTSEKTSFKLKESYAVRKKLFRGKILDVQLSKFLKDNMRDLTNNLSMANELLSDYHNTCKNLEYISIVDKLFKSSLKLLPGNMAPDFELQDINGNIVSLKSLKGKVVFIDFWATWCKPCLSSMPKTLKLIDKFKDNKDVVYLLINVSDDMERWKSYLMEENLPGINLFADKNQSKIIRDNFNISGIPHYIIIDKEGKFIDAKTNNGVDAERQITRALN